MGEVGNNENAICPGLPCSDCFSANLCCQTCVHASVSKCFGHMQRNSSASIKSHSLRHATLATTVGDRSNIGNDAMKRPGPNLIRKTISLASAIVSGRRISADRIRNRIEICARCRFVRIRKTRNGRKLNCRICGCRLRGDRSLINLARYEETRHYGCKHPRGSRWKKSGV